MPPYRTIPSNEEPDIPRREALNLVRLQPDTDIRQSESGTYNYSKHYGDYNHFVNVIAALVRLIAYFRDENNVSKLVTRMKDRSDSRLTYEANSEIQLAENSKNKSEDSWVGNLKYENQPDLRQFKLILAGFYHDIGKTIQNPRHAMEGAIILESHTTEARNKLHKMVDDYCQLNKINPAWKFDRDDLLFISDLVLYHDQYGTLSTGEDGYLQLVDVIDSIHRYSLKESNKPQERLEWSRRYIFDLWLLNVADIMVSIKDKWILQTVWENLTESENTINSFLFNTQEKAHSAFLIHDLQISFELLDNYCCQKHLDDLTELKQKAHKLSLQHVVERLRRLMISTLTNSIDGYKEKNTEMGRIANCIDKLSEEEWNSTIVRAIEATANREEFSRRFSWLKKSDYALGFFERIAKTAFKMIEECKAFGWTYVGDASKFTDDYIYKTKAQFIADNYVITVIQILGHLLFREQSLDNPRNVEFNDATKRLTENKINQILSFEGPSRARKSIDLILQTIYVY
jgi:hypothetical protein